MTFSSSSLSDAESSAILLLNSLIPRCSEEVRISRLPGTQSCAWWGVEVIWRMGGQKSHLEFHQVHLMALVIANFRDAHKCGYPPHRAAPFPARTPASTRRVTTKR